MNKWLLILIVISLALYLTACGDDDDNGGGEVDVEIGGTYWEVLDALSTQGYAPEFGALVLASAFLLYVIKKGEFHGSQTRRFDV